MGRMYALNKATMKAIYTVKTTIPLALLIFIIDEYVSANASRIRKAGKASLPSANFAVGG